MFKKLLSSSTSTLADSSHEDVDFTLHSMSQKIAELDKNQSLMEDDTVVYLSWLVLLACCIDDMATVRKAASPVMRRLLPDRDQRKALITYAIQGEAHYQASMYWLYRKQLTEEARSKFRAVLQQHSLMLLFSTVKLVNIYDVFNATLFDDQLENGKFLDILNLLCLKMQAQLLAECIRHPRSAKLVLEKIPHYVQKLPTRWLTSNLLNKGGFGKIYQYKVHRADSHGSETLVIKFPVFSQENKSKCIIDFAGEMALHSRLKHECIVQFKGVYACPKDYKIGLVLECMSVSVQEIIDSASRTENYYILDSLRHKIIVSVLDALLYLHETMLISHNDIKPDNILLDNILKPEESIVKLSDFGFASLLFSPKSGCGTMHYMAPELFQSEGYCSDKTDMYSFAMTVYSLVMCIAPWHGLPKRSNACLHPLLFERSCISRIVQGIRPVIETTVFDKPLKQITTQNWVGDPQKRWTARQTLEFFQASNEQSTHLVHGTLNAQQPVK